MKDICSNMSHGRFVFVLFKRRPGRSTFVRSAFVLFKSELERSAFVCSNADLGRSAFDLFCMRTCEGLRLEIKHTLLRLHLGFKVRFVKLHLNVLLFLSHRFDLREVE